MNTKKLFDFVQLIVFGLSAGVSVAIFCNGGLLSILLMAVGTFGINVGIWYVRHPELYPRWLP